jgi:hypothetical protein
MWKEGERPRREERRGTTERNHQAGNVCLLPGHCNVCVEYAATFVCVPFVRSGGLRAKIEKRAKKRELGSQIKMKETPTPNLLIH